MGEGGSVTGYACALGLWLRDSVSLHGTCALIAQSVYSSALLLF
jgi:hypothetical protein